MNTSISYAAAFRAKTFRQPVSVSVSRAPGLAYGPSSPDAFATFDPATSSWKTVVISLFGDSMPFSEISASSGSMQNGRLFRRAPLVRHTDDAGCSLWPTARVAMSRAKCHITPSRIANKRIGKGNLEEVVALWGGNSDGYLNPTWIEWHMGFPSQWSALDCEPSATP